MNTGVGVNQDALGGESLRAVTGNGITVIEVPVFGSIEFDAAIVIDSDGNSTVRRD